VLTASNADSDARDDRADSGGAPANDGDADAIASTSFVSSGLIIAAAAAADEADKDEVDNDVEEETECALFAAVGSIMAGVLARIAPGSVVFAPPLPASTERGKIDADDDEAAADDALARGPDNPSESSTEVCDHLLCTISSP